MQLGTAYLVRAWNDEGKLGAVTKATLKAQATRLGRMTSSQVGAQQGKYRLMRQIELIKSAAVTIKTPTSHTVKNDPYTKMLSRKAHSEEDPLDCLDIASLMSHIRVDPKLIGENQIVPLSLFHILTELGIQRLEDILCRSRKAEPTIIDASELKQRYGSKVTRKHQIALTRLTLLAMLAHEGPVQAELKHDPIAFNSLASLPIELRYVNRTLLEADFARHRRSGSPTCEGRWQPDSSQTATQLICKAMRTAFGRPAPVEKIMLNMTSSSRRKSNTKRSLDRQLYRPREVLKAAETLADTPQDSPNSPNLLLQRTRKAKNPENIKSMSCHYIAHSDDLDAFLDKFTYPQSMNDGSPPEVDITSAFENIEIASDQQSAADFQSWTKFCLLKRPKKHLPPQTPSGPSLEPPSATSSSPIPEISGHSPHPDEPGTKKQAIRARKPVWTSTGDQQCLP